MKKALSAVLILFILAVAVPAGLWGRTSQQVPNSMNPSQVTPQAEEHLQREALHQLRLLPYYTIFDNLEFRVEGSTVVLSGQVVWPALKSDAEGVVKHIEGVDRVINNIEVLPVSDFDNGIRWAVARTIYRYPGMERYAFQAMPPIHILVKNGHVTLVGVVSNEMDKNVAGIRANSVPNVFSVTNDLRVEK